MNIEENDKTESHFDLYGDVAKIKAALFDTTQDIKGKASEVINDSVENIKKQTAAVKDNVTNYTEKKPFKSLSIALLCGIVVGYFLHGKNNKG